MLFLHMPRVMQQTIKQENIKKKVQQCLSNIFSYKPKQLFIQNVMVIKMMVKQLNRYE